MKHMKKNPFTVITLIYSSQWLSKMIFFHLSTGIMVHSSLHVWYHADNMSRIKQYRQETNKYIQIKHWKEWLENRMWGS